MKKAVFFGKAVALLLMMSLMFTMLTGCGSKKSVTTEEFMTAAGESGLQCVDVKEQFKDYDFITEATIAAASDFSYQVEFYVFSDSSQAQSFYVNNKTNFDLNKGSVYTDVSTSGKNYARYALNSGDRYMFVAYVDNTVIYADTDQTHKANVEALVDALKY